MSSEALALDNPFWRFSLRVYAAPGVADECLALQDAHGVDINVLLLCAWAGAVKRSALGASDVQSFIVAVGRWQRQAVGPLRLARRNIKAMPEMSHAEVAALRGQLADLELRAEQIEQALLFAAAHELPAGDIPASAGDIVAANIATLLRFLGVDGQARGTNACARLVAAAAAVQSAAASPSGAL